MYQIRPIQATDNTAVRQLIHTVMPEFGAGGAGFAIQDPEVEQMYEAYQKPRAAYFVVVDAEEQVLGAAGIAPLLGGEATTCEVQKMYFMPSLRGKGMGQQLLKHCLKVAKDFGFDYCYLETLTQMTAARALYEKNGFVPLEKAMGNTGHFGCNCFYGRSL